MGASVPGEQCSLLSGVSPTECIDQYASFAILCAVAVGHINEARVRQMTSEQSFKRALGERMNEAGSFVSRVCRVLQSGCGRSR